MVEDYSGPYTLKIVTCSRRTLAMYRTRRDIFPQRVSFIYVGR